jgi:hypothetical protein
MSFIFGAVIKMVLTTTGQLVINDSTLLSSATLEVNGTTLLRDKLCFTQTDLNEYIDSLADGYLDIRYTTALRIGDGTNYSSFEADGTLVFNGTATVWDDFRISATSSKLGGTKDPGFTVFKTNGSGSQGVFVYWFDASTEEELYFVVQMPHSWAGTAITPHVHWVPKTTSDEAPTNQAVEWGLEYTWADEGTAFGNTSIIYAKSTVVPLVADTHYRTDFAAITPSASQDGLSSMLVCRIFRNATDATDDTYEDDAGLLEIDFHYELNTVGSRAITTK